MRITAPKLLCFAFFFLILFAFSNNLSAKSLRAKKNDRWRSFVITAGVHNVYEPIRMSSVKHSIGHPMVYLFEVVENSGVIKQLLDSVGQKLCRFAESRVSGSTSKLYFLLADFWHNVGEKSGRSRKVQTAALICTLSKVFQMANIILIFFYISQSGKVV